MAETILTSKPMRDAGTLTRPAFSMPEGACDSHVHVFEAAANYPSVETPHYTLPDGSLSMTQIPTSSIRQKGAVAAPNAIPAPPAPAAAALPNAAPTPAPESRNIPDIPYLSTLIVPTRRPRRGLPVTE